MKPLLTPSERVVRIDAKTRGLCRKQAPCIVDLGGRGSAVDALERAELQLARGVVAAVTDDASGLENPLGLFPRGLRLLG